MLDTIKQYERDIEKALDYGRKMQDPDRYEEFKKESL